MDTDKRHIRHGVGAVRPYLYGHLDLLDFVKEAFGAVELERLKTGRGFHVEARIDDSMVVMEVGEHPPNVTLTRASIYVYVKDVDEAYKRAIRAGATSLAEPTDKPYQERGAGVRDSFGNIWWIATYKG